MRRAIGLTLLGLVGLTAFAWFVWEPLALLPPSVAALGLGLFADWEVPRGKPGASHHPKD